MKKYLLLLLLTIGIASTTFSQTVSNPTEVFAPDLNAVTSESFYINFTALKAKGAQNVTLVVQYDPTILEIQGCSTQDTIVPNPTVLNCQQVSNSTFHLAVKSIKSFGDEGVLIRVKALALAPGYSDLRMWVAAFHDRNGFMSTVATHGSVAVR